MSDRPDKPSRDRVQVTPDPSNPDLFKFLEKLFLGDDQAPQKIEVRQAYGPGGRKFGLTVDVKEFKPNAAKPTREELVGLSNRFLDAAQLNCNTLGKNHKYGILAKHNTKGADYYNAFVISLKPTQDAEYDPNNPEAADDEDIVSDAKRRDSLLEYSLRHLSAGDENDRWRQDQFSTTVGDLVSKYESFLSIMVAQNVSMMQEHRELIKTADEALSHKLDRELAIEKARFNQEIMNRTFTMLSGLAPLAIAKLQGKQTPPGEPSAETMVIKAFLEGLNEEQAKALFGTIADGKLIGDGILSTEQTEIIAGIAECRFGVEALDRLSDGPLAITPNQLTEAQKYVSMQQAAGLIGLIMERRKAKG